MSLLRDTYEKAILSLRSCCHPAGLKASGRNYGHHQVWTRDSMIALLGGVLTDDELINDALRSSLQTIRERQTPSGCIPNNVDTTSQRANFRAYADGGLWWIVGSSIAAPDLPTIKTILDWYECQDVDRSGLLSMQESTDWQDLFCTRGKGLYLNCLYVLALKLAARLASSADNPELAAAWSTRADLTRERINQFHWYRGDGDMRRHVSHTFSTESPEDQDSLGRKRYLPVKRLMVEEHYYLPYLGFRAVGEWFDSLGHLLAILSGVAGGTRAETILDFVEREGLAAEPMRAIYPPVQDGDPDWRDYYGMLNTPHHYHNGGIWPFIGGFYVAALVCCGRVHRAEAALTALAELNRKGEFNEWHHGETGEPMGVRDQAWSSGMYIFAHDCVTRGEVPHLHLS